MIRFSFVAAAYNCAAQVAQFARTVQEFQGLSVEFCVADGGSSDQTAELLGRTPGVTLVCSEPDLGIYDAWNKGVAASSGEYIAFIGLDDRPMKAFLLRVLAELEAGHSADFYYGDAVLTRNGRYRSWRSPESPRLFQSRDIRFDIAHPGAFNSRKLFASGGFDSSFRLAGDLDFYVRAVRARPRFTWCRLGLIQAEIGADGASRSAGASLRYRAELERIAEASGASLAPQGLLSPLQHWIESRPMIFSAMKELSWLLRGQKHVRSAD